MCWEPHYKNTQNDQRRKYTNNHYKPKVLIFKKKGERERERERERVANKAKTFFTNITKFKQSEGQIMGGAREIKEEG